MNSSIKAGAIAAAICAFGLLAGMALAHETLTTTVLFDREIVRILSKHCVMCHDQGGPSFPLDTYEQTFLQRRKIRAEIIARHMPPWAAVPGYGQFANDNSLTLQETQFIVSWVEGLGPRNSGTVFTNVAGADAARPNEIRAHADAGHWLLGMPDLARQLPANTIEPRAPDQVKRVVVDLGLTSERRVRAVEFMPGDRRVVHAAFFTVEETGEWIGSWTPWYGVMTLPKGVAYRLPAGAHVVAEINYRGAQERAVDRGTLGLFFAGSSSSNTASDLVLDAKGAVPAGAQSQRFHAEQRLAEDTYAAALRPELLPGANSVEVSARRPDGGTQVLLFAKDVPADWPSPYILREPVVILKGSILAVTAYYSNSAKTSKPGGFRVTMTKYSNAGFDRK
ncbi:MAG: hypothetical protein JO307_11005 [Bryobacterales bacterium]|nr:hypothetical protein [Bryobacterales bacterium]MBV9399919.1 hypothetical protein [Bryobacterales bacterium]